MAWKPYGQMSRIEQKMHHAVLEETMLHELPMSEVDHLGAGRDVVWPAESPEHCSEVLLGWFSAGLITVMKTRSQEALPWSEARAILADPRRWSPEHLLVVTDAGEVAWT